jgi:hypothetical protein
MNTDHVQCYTCEVSCNHCGLAPTLDAMSAVALIDVVRGFLLMHRRCHKPVEPSKQVELFDALAAKEAGREIPIICVVCNGPLKDGEDPLTHLDQCRRKARSAADMETEDECSARTVREEMREATERGKELAQGIDGMSDEPDPETDPPGALDIFAKMFPMPRDATHLTRLVLAVLPLEQHAKFRDWSLPTGAGFDEIAHWARTEQARIDAQGRAQRGEPGIPGLYIPTARMPLCLSEALGLTKKKRGARPLSSPSPKQKKRRSGSTQHTS